MKKASIMLAIILFISITFAYSEVAITDDGVYTASGNGSAILDGFMLSEAPARIVAKSTELIYVTTCHGQMTTQYGLWSSSFADLIKDSYYYKNILVQTQGKWDIEISPLKNVESSSFEYTGSYVSDMFMIDTPAIAIMTFDDHGKSDKYTVDFYTLKKDGSLDYKPWIIVDSAANNTDLRFVIAPDVDAVSYFVHVNCNHSTTDWTFSIEN